MVKYQKRFQGGNAMKKLTTALLIFLMLLTAALNCACGRKEPEMPKLASDADVIAKWEEYAVLDGIPRYALGGIFDNFSPGEDGNVIVSFLGVSKDDFLAYTETLQAEGFRLKEDSSVWLNEGMSGTPTFVRNGRAVTLIWYMNGGLDINVGIAD